MQNAECRIERAPRRGIFRCPVILHSAFCITTMHRSYHRWFSPALGRDMELLVFGHAGARVLAFPASMHPFYDWEDRGLVGALRPHLEKGRLQLFCVDQIDRESWYARDLHPARKAQR